MTNETRFVVEPLVRWLKGQKASWRISTPAHETAERGWDIEASRKNQVLLIEAKYIAGPSISSLAGLVTAPLADRKYPSSSYGVCWAIGIKDRRDMHQILLDFLARNQKFWKHYGDDLRIKSIFFVQHGKVTRIPFATFLRITHLYAARAKGKTLGKRREIAKELLSQYL